MTPSYTMGAPLAWCLVSKTSNIRVSQTSWPVRASTAYKNPSVEKLISLSSYSAQSSATVGRDPATRGRPRERAAILPHQVAGRGVMSSQKLGGVAKHR